MPAPLIATALAAIAPALARRGLDLLSGVFRGSLDQGAAAVSQLIEEKTGIDINRVADGALKDDEWAKLRAFELEYEVKLLEYRQQAEASRIEGERIHQQDRASARDLQKVALASDDPVARRFIYFYATGITLLTFVFIFYAAFFHDYTGNEDATRIIDTVLGFLLGVSLSAIIQYFFGSSAGSKAKAEQIDAISKDLAANSTRDNPSQGGGA